MGTEFQNIQQPTFNIEHPFNAELGTRNAEKDSQPWAEGRISVGIVGDLSVLILIDLQRKKGILGQSTIHESKNVMGHF